MRKVVARVCSSSSLWMTKLVVELLESIQIDQRKGQQINPSRSAR